MASPAMTSGGTSYREILTLNGSLYMHSSWYSVWLAGYPSLSFNMYIKMYGCYFLIKTH